MSFALDQAGVLQLSVTGRCRSGDGDGSNVEPPLVPTLFHFAHFRKINVLGQGRRAKIG
jgi:hypothetical protein